MFLRRLTIGIVFSLHTAFGNEECGSQLLDIVDKYSNVSKMPNGEISEYEIVYTVKPLPNSKVPVTRIPMKFTLARSIYISSDANSAVYSDSSNTFTVITKERKIIWSKNSVFDKGNNVIQSNTELFKNIVGYKCSTLALDNKNLKKIECEPSEALKKEQKITHVEYLLEGSDIYSVKLLYAKEAGVSFAETRYSKITRSPMPAHYKSGVRALFLVSGTEKLLKKYAGYTLEKVNKK